MCVCVILLSNVASDNQLILLMFPLSHHSTSSSCILPLSSYCIKCYHTVHHQITWVVVLPMFSTARPWSHYHVLWAILLWQNFTWSTSFFNESVEASYAVITTANPERLTATTICFLSMLHASYGFAPHLHSGIICHSQSGNCRSWLWKLLLISGSCHLLHIPNVKVNDLTTPESVG